MYPLLYRTAQTHDYKNLCYTEDNLHPDHCSPWLGQASLDFLAPSISGQIRMLHRAYICTSRLEYFAIMYHRTSLHTHH